MQPVNSVHAHINRARRVLPPSLAVTLLILFTGCTSGPTRAEHEAQIEQLEATLKYTVSERDQARSDAERWKQEVADNSTRALSTQAPAQAELVTCPFTALDLWMANQDGRKEMYNAFKLEVLERCSHNGCGLIVPPLMVLEMQLTKGN